MWHVCICRGSTHVYEKMCTHVCICVWRAHMCVRKCVHMCAYTWRPGVDFRESSSMTFWPFLLTQGLSIKLRAHCIANLSNQLARDLLDLPSKAGITHRPLHPPTGSQACVTSTLTTEHPCAQGFASCCFHHGLWASSPQNAHLEIFRTVHSWMELQICSNRTRIRLFSPGDLFP